MKYVIISDIHANLEALEVAKSRIDSIKPDRIICLGDVVGYGASPNECVEIVKELTDLVVAGNHDWGVIGKTDIRYFNAYAQQAVIWTRKNLKPANFEYLENLGLTYFEANVLRAVHATPDHPERWSYIFTYQQAIMQFEAFEEMICFIGHSHQPVVFELTGEKITTLNSESIRLRDGHRYIVNAGSVGQPRDGDPRVCLCIYDESSKEVRIERLEYDVESARQRIINAGLPSVLGNRLLWGE